MLAIQPRDARGGRADREELRGATPLRVSVDGRPLDNELRRHGIGRYAQGLLAELGAVAVERGGTLVVVREGDVHRPPLPARAAELVEQALLPLDLRRVGTAVHHSLSLYGTPALARAAVVVSMHDVVPLQSPAEYLRTGVAHRVLYRAVRRAAAVMCPSRSAARDVRREVGVRTTVIPYAAHERFRPTDPAALRARLGVEGPYLLYVGGLEDPRKDVAGLVRAFVESGRAETLVLAGPGDAPSAERVVRAGFVPDADLPALYTGASCFVTASRYEGFGLPALEAIACGTPVAAYDTGAIPETAGPGAVLVTPGDTAALIRAAGRVCDEPELAQRLSAEGRRHAGRFSWRRTAELTWDVYERVAAAEAR